MFARWSLRLGLLSLVVALVACDDDDSTTYVYVDAGGAAGCAPACSAEACEICDESGAAPVCVGTCGAGTTCQAGACVADAPATCEPACGDCQACDTTGAAPVCVDLCGAGAACVEGACVGESPAACEPACGDCQICDTAGDAPVCVDLCGVGSACVDGQCQAVIPATCEPACGPCQTCDASGEAPACVDLCGDGAACVGGVCEALPPATCEPACGPCQVCDATGDAPVCVDSCGAGAECADGVCVPTPGPTCEPACGDCQACDLAADPPVCVDACGARLACVDGVCQAGPPPACEPACGDCQVCDVSGDAPVCVDLCGGGEYCDAGACVRGGRHVGFDALAGAFATGPEVTQACLNCHQTQADHFVQTAHWRWAGPTPTLEGHEDETGIGKRNLINNFCIATTSNEARCTQCHAGYDWRSDAFDFEDRTKIDCLVCHADPSLYSKAATAAGNPPPEVDLRRAARSVGQPTVGNCGQCHFAAGGGDNVKKGDLGSALATATPDVDVHMGRGMSCADCHAGPEHRLLGLSAHGAVSEGRVACADCHTNAPHDNGLLDNHALDVACQTCHVPAFSRQQPTKMFWDWATAGDNGRGPGGIQMGALADGTPVPVYDAKKGDFRWEKNVRPVYRWFDGRVARMTTDDAYPAGMGTEENPIVLGQPLADHDSADAVIWPFKDFRGRQAVDPAQNILIVPRLFGPGGFWASLPAPDAYSQEAVDAIWATAMTDGARAAGQIAPDASYAVGDWAWAYTVLYLGIDHEVAPAAQALGCGDCHDNAAFDFEALGYTCDPMTGGAGCGSRH